MKRFLKGILERLGYRVEGTRYVPRHLYRPECLLTLEFDDVVCRYMFEHLEACNFVQIGAYDGILNDPLHKYIRRCGWRGVMLEPQPGPAERLRELYKNNDDIVVIEAAIDATRRTRTLYTADSDKLPSWSASMASFDREHFLRHGYLPPEAEDAIREIAVKCISFEDVLASRPKAMNSIDLLQIDAEGADGDILSWFPFDRQHPAIVHWEIKNMTTREQECTLDLLCGHGYRVARSGGEDMIAVHGERI